jgi:hypothetical protein
MHPLALDYGERSPGRVLSRAGFEVFLLGWQGQGPRSASTFEGVLRDVIPPALDRVRALTGRPRVAWWGLGAGGLLGLSASARREPLSAVIAVGAGAALAPARPAAWLQVLSQALPSGWRLPLKRAGRLGALAVDQRVAQRADLPGPTARGLLRFGLEDAPLGLVKQGISWRLDWSSGDGPIDHLEALRGARNAALLVEEEAYRPGAVRLAQHWGSPEATVLSSATSGLGWLAASAEAWAPALAWLTRQHAGALDASRGRDSSPARGEHDTGA